MLVYLLSILSLSFAQTTQPPLQNLFTISASQSVTFRSTLAQVQISIRVEVDLDPTNPKSTPDSCATDAQNGAATRSAAVVAILQNPTYNVSTLETASVSLQALNNWNSGSSVFYGYAATNSISFRVPIDETGTLLSALLNAGATSIDSTTFVADDETIEAAAHLALRQAAVKAADRALITLNAIGQTALHYHNIDTDVSCPGGNPVPLPFATGGAMAAMTMATPMPVLGDEQSCTATVSLTIDIGTGRFIKPTNRLP